MLVNRIVELGIEESLASPRQQTTMYEGLYSHLERMVQDRTLRCEHGLKRDEGVSVEKGGCCE